MCTVDKGYLAFDMCTVLIDSTTTHVACMTDGTSLSHLHAALCCVYLCMSAKALPNGMVTIALPVRQ